MSINSVAQRIRDAEAVTIIIGAGASRSAGIPTAPDLVKTINADFPDCLVHLTAEQRTDYGAVMGALSPGERKKLIEPLLENARLNWGHIALAAIIASQKVKRILTFNFDLILEKTTSLLGMHLPVYDFGVSPTKELGRLASPAIFHLHGQSYGLRLLNSGDETEKHLGEIGPLLADSLRNHLTVVIGYSGEADPAFKVVEKEYNSYVRLFWLGYEKEAKPHLAPLLAKNYARYIGGCDFDRTMIEIAHILGVWPPEIFKNPPNHLLTALKEVAEYPVQKDAERDILTETRRRLAEAANGWEQGKSPLERTQAALLEGVAPDPVDNESGLPDEERDARAWSYLALGNRCSDLAKEMEGTARSAKFLEARAHFAEALRIRPNMPEALYNWGVTFAEEARGLDGQLREDKLLEACTKYAEALRVEPNMQEAAFNWGVALTKLAEGMNGGARAAKSAEACEKFAEAVRIRPDDWEALSNWVGALLYEADALTGAAKVEKHTEARELGLRCKEILGSGVYNLACVNALLGYKEDALSELEACLASNKLPDLELIKSDPDLDTLRDSKRFDDLLKAIQEVGAASTSAYRR